MNRNGRIFGFEKVNDLMKTNNGKRLVEESKEEPHWGSIKI